MGRCCKTCLHEQFVTAFTELAAEATEQQFAYVTYDPTNHRFPKIYDQNLWSLTQTYISYVVIDISKLLLKEKALTLDVDDLR